MNVKKQTLVTLSGREVHILSEWENDIKSLLLRNRNINPDDSVFFHPRISDLSDPFLMPDMEAAVKRIFEAKKRDERIVIFGDYDVDGVSSTALLVRFLSQELGCQVSYRLPHRVHDGYGLKDYFFDELHEKNVKLVITVDCGTRDIVPIQYAKSLGIDVIVTDHHAVPEEIPKEVIGILNPKRKDSKYPFPHLAGAGVAFTLIHALVLRLETKNPDALLTEYIDIASLGTVADCMPLIGENRIITTLGLRQMKASQSAGLRKFLENTENIEGNADIIGFQIWPRINASGRMDTPLTALRWLLASEDRCDGFLEEIERLNTKRKTTVSEWQQQAQEHIDTSKPVLIYTHPELEHGIIGLIAGKLTEIYHRPSIVLCPGSKHIAPDGNEVETLVASCRSPEWCDLIPLLDSCRDMFVRYGGHRQAAGFTLENAKLSLFSETINALLSQQHPDGHFPAPMMRVDAAIRPHQLSLETLDIIDSFRPFGIGNPRPVWLLEKVTISEYRSIGNQGNHLRIRIHEHPIVLVYWNGHAYGSPCSVGSTVSFLITLESHEWQWSTSLQGIVHDIITDP